MSTDCYHIVDCGDVECVLCPQVYRHAKESEAIDTAKAHHDKNDVLVLDVTEDE